jgi:branched-chain amino acid transport system substrate-binding protein
MTKIRDLAAVVGLTAALLGSTLARADEVLKLGLSVSMSGAAAVWGLGMDWAAKQAAQSINDSGGVKVNGKTYRFEVMSLDNKYNAAEGAKVAQTLVNREGVRYIVATIGTAPTMALQSLTERKGVLMFTGAWGMAMKGPKFPLTFTQVNSPSEIAPPLYGYVKQQHPAIKTAVILNPNDATGKETEVVSRKVWESLGVKVLSSDWYERGTTEFQPIAAKMAGFKPDVIDLGTAPPGDSSVILKEMHVLGWKGQKVITAGTSAEALVKVSPEAAEGTYLGVSADFEGAQATPVQRKLNLGMMSAVGEAMNVLHVGAYDAVMALKAGMEAANSIEPAAIAAVLPKIIFETSYGKTAFGGKATYGSPQQILVPVMVTQIRSGKLVEVERIVTDELKQRLAAQK